MLPYTAVVHPTRRVHVKHTDGSFEYVPYFCLPAKDLNDVIAPSCYSCFDYPNALADMVVGRRYVKIIYTYIICVYIHMIINNTLYPLRLLRLPQRAGGHGGGSAGGIPTEKQYYVQKPILHICTTVFIDTVSTNTVVFVLHGRRGVTLCEGVHFRSGSAF